MQIVLLVEERLLPIPASIKTVTDWDRISIQTNTEGVIRGSHMLLEGSEEDFQAWLRPFDGVWVGVGAAQLQEFKVMHVR